MKNETLDTRQHLEILAAQSRQRSSGNFVGKISLGDDLFGQTHFCGWDPC